MGQRLGVPSPSDGVFGVDLKKLHARRPGVPEVVSRCCAYLEVNADAEGLFRTPASRYISRRGRSLRAAVSLAAAAPPSPLSLRFGRWVALHKLLTSAPPPLPCAPGPRGGGAAEEPRVCGARGAGA